MTSRPLRVAFIGAGRMAREHLRCIRRLSTPAIVVGVHDQSEGNAAEFGELANVRPSASIDALFVDTQPDVVHVCTPPAAHVECALAAIERGAHVYVEKPFATSAIDARAVLDLARARGVLVCAGHQLLKDEAFERLLARAPGLGSLVQVDSHFTFRPQISSGAGMQARAAQLADILPHPLYSLIAVLERVAPDAAMEIAGLAASADDLQVLLRAGTVTGRLSVSLRARPIASSLTLTGTDGALTCDFVRSILIGAANSGTEPLEKMLNPLLEGFQLASRTATSVCRRIAAGGSYPGLAALVDDFYRAVGTAGASPVSPAHLSRVTELFEILVAAIEAATRRPEPARRGAPSRAPQLLLTGARGFLGSRIAAAVAGGVRGVARAAGADDPHVDEWVVADLSEGLPRSALRGITTVIHAAAETAGGYEAHQRNTVDATRKLLRAMAESGVTRLVFVSSLSVVRPPRTPWERQDERTPRPDNARALGPYVWGKTRQEELVVREAAALGIVARIVRPGALIDATDPALPGAAGRRLFGRWHLGLGRPRVPLPACDVDRCAAAIAWCATHFDEAPPLVNLFDPAIATRGALVAHLHALGWRGRVVWVPISVVASGLSFARTLASFLQGRWPGRLATWSLLRPRRIDGTAGAALLAVSGAQAMECGGATRLSA